ncbi:MAG: hypothetical protein R3B40_09115 [Polyangiales bacterium]|nr:hypothetical protein [Myxococcales bacterium]
MTHLPLFSLVMVAIITIDYLLGPTAEYLNAYEILRRSVPLPLPQVAEGFLLRQETLGSIALPVGWALFAVEAGVVTVLLEAVGRLGLRAFGGAS